MVLKTTQSAIQKAVHPDADAPEEVRHLDPNVQQNKASRPESSVWVTASAGTGKTKVLTDRVLRLLLPRIDGQPGTKPARILCLTFTKAGAGEMAVRLTKTLTNWAVMPPDELREALKTLQGRAPAKTDLEAARRLFAEVTDTPGGLKIMTIHSFCQSVLGRFPLEAGIPPHFKPLQDGDAALLLEQARDQILNRIQTEPSSSLHTALERIAGSINEEQFFDLIRNITREREQLQQILEKHFSIEGIYQKLCMELNLQPGLEPTEILKTATFDEPALRKAIKALATHGTDKEGLNALTIQTWLESADKVSGFENYCRVFLKKDGGILQKLATVGVERAVPGTTVILQREAERIYALKDRMNAASSALLTRDLLILGKEILDVYQALKTERAALDFDDLIFMTCALLEGRAAKLQGDSAASWVLYKLDQGIDHILIDEAQDTNPEQWRVVQALCNEFTAGLGASEVERTVFVVGDEKQSIYSFQRASPEEFSRMRKFLRERVQSAKKEWDDVPMNISFRSAQSVLQAVDAVFTGAMQTGVSQTPVKHSSYRQGQAGRVELWPLFETPPDDPFDVWQPTQIVESHTAAAKLAAHIADQIKNWIQNGEKLPSHDRPIRPGDIMILLRTRNAFFNQIAKALKDKKIPVSGTDRMILSEQIAVQDLIAFAQFALQTDDDLTLACLLKSPLIGMDEDSLFALAHARKGSLWTALRESKHETIVHYLNTTLHNAAYLRPFDFFSALLQNKCPADNISGLRAFQTRLGSDVMDPIDEFLNLVLDYEAQHIPSLQNFIHWQSHEETEIKREMEEKGNFVRIMTVHGAKGLQAPIVILPDTIRAQRGQPSKIDRRLLWPDKTERATPLWSPRKSESFAEYDAAMASLDAREDEEYRRLLYVAMTRAEDRLYLAGYTGKRGTALPDSWYFALKSGMESIAQIETLSDGTLRVENLQTKDPDQIKKEETVKKEKMTAPKFLFESAQTEKSETIFRPSREGEMEPTAHSPLQPGNIHRFRRGNLTHKLLEFLPNLPLEKREVAAQNFLNRFAADIAEDIRINIADEILQVLHHPDFSAVFGPGSRAEVPITGRMKDGRIISGQIDRLLVTDQEILIIDYKTNRPPPLDPRDIPVIYRNQMAAYAEALGQIYPNRTVSCALLWTDGPRLMPLKA